MEDQDLSHAVSSIKDSDIKTERVVERRSFLGQAGMFLVGAASILLSNSVSARAANADNDKKDKSDKSSDTKDSDKSSQHQDFKKKADSDGRDTTNNDSDKIRKGDRKDKD